MDYQRACGIHPGHNTQGIGRCAWRTPYGVSQTQIPRMPEVDTDGESSCPMADCCEHLAIVTSPVQCWQKLFTPCEALSMGTLFKELNLPLVGCVGDRVGYDKNTGTTYRRM